MSIRILGIVGAVVALAAAGACRPKVAPTPAPSPDVIVLVPDPEDNRVGAATVSSPQGSVELTDANVATRVIAGQAPSVPAPMAADEIQRRFADALAARPLASRQFLLYFESGGNTLTPESQAQVPEIVAFVSGRPGADVSVIGHTDTTGDATANADLGMRRAALIRDLLVKSGIDQAQLEVASHGEADPLVPTPDDTAEERNRRVEVTVR